jgi:hypothetical protein
MLHALYSSTCFNRVFLKKAYTPDFIPERRFEKCNQLEDVLWDVAPCNLVEIYRRFRGVAALMMEAASTAETSVNLYQTTRHYIPEDIFILAAVRT